MTENGQPWYRWATRWGQTNLTELDPVRYDSDWWKEYWRRTRTQGIVVNAGGIVAYYPSRYALHYRAEHLGNGDLYGRVVADAREEGLLVLARMDSSRAHESVYQEHPDWFTVDRQGRPYRAGAHYIACINGPYYEEYLPGVFREIIERSSPEGFTDNSWTGLGRDRICYCRQCAARFETASGMPLPKEPSWDDESYRRWILWSYERRLQIWEANNAVTKAAGGPHCLWIGTTAGGGILPQSLHFFDWKRVCERAEVIMLDYQWRKNADGFQANSGTGTLINGLLGWDKLIAESNAMYGAGDPSFRVSSKPEAEARLWMVEALAGGMRPRWHHIGAYHDDRRQYATAGPMFRWCEANEEYLSHRKPAANVGVVWSQRNADFFGRDDADIRTELPRRGFCNALLADRIPYVMVHADHIDRDAGKLDVLVLPNLGLLSQDQSESVRRFAQGGGGVVATGETSLYGEWGDKLDDFALADILGVHATGAHHGQEEWGAPDRLDWSRHTYLRIRPGLQGIARGGPGALATTETVATRRHPVFRGFDDTDLLPFGGRIEVVGADRDEEAYVTFVPPFPVYPPEFAWMRHPETRVVGLVLRELPGGGRVAYFPADLDRCYGRDNLPDHAALLSNGVRWAAQDRVPIKVNGAGLIDCQIYEQGERRILHLVNLSNPGAWKGQIRDLIPIGPLTVGVRVPGGRRTKPKLLVAGKEVEVSIQDGWHEFTVPSIADHEVVVV